MNEKYKIITGINSFSIVDISTNTTAGVFFDQLLADKVLAFLNRPDKDEEKYIEFINKNKEKWRNEITPPANPITTIP